MASTLRKIVPDATYFSSTTLAEWTVKALQRDFDAMQKAL